VAIQFPEPGTANEELFNALVRHQIYLLRLSGSIRNKITALLNATEDDIARQIRDRLQGMGGLETPASVNRMNSVLRIIKNTRTKAWSQVDEAWVAEALSIANQEPESIAQMIRVSAPVVLDMAIPAAAQLAAIVKSQPFEGRTLRQWAASIQADDLARIANAVRVGMVQGESSAQIAARVVGTARLNGIDGVTEITRRQAEAITRTMVNYVGSEARDDFIKANSDLISQEQFVATLDSRTTPICRANDGKLYDVGAGPRPPLHWNCRSLRVPVLLEQPLGERPAKPTTQRMLLRQYAEQEGLDEVPKSRDDLPFGHKGSFDDFARQQIRAMTGTVPAATSYNDWLKGQSAEFQDDVLGKTKGVLFRKGDLPLDRFVNRQGDELTLHELAQRERSAFIAAGLNPDEY
jgi:SPP1 gp7 family putative phage head morphogenesis protein